MQSSHQNRLIQFFNVLSHLIGFPILYIVSRNYDTLQSKIFLLTCFMILSCSIAYHSLKHLYAKSRILDRVAILLAVPTFLCLFTTMCNSIAVTLFSVYTIFFFGFHAYCAANEKEKNETITNVSILMHSWTFVFFLKETSAYKYYVAGGIFYSIGLIAYFLDDKWPALHILWHLLVICGMCCHALAFVK